LLLFECLRFNLTWLKDMVKRYFDFDQERPFMNHYFSSLLAEK